MTHLDNHQRLRPSFATLAISVLVMSVLLLPTTTAQEAPNLDGHQHAHDDSPGELPAQSHEAHKHGAGYSAASSPDSEVGTCPVMPGEPLDERFSLLYGDEKITFCCAQCQRTFERNPEPYLAALTPAAAAAVRAASSTPKDGFAADLKVENHLDLVALAVVALIALLLWRRGHQSGALALLGIGLVLAVGLANWRSNGHLAELSEAREELRLLRFKELIHNNTYYVYGNPPRPLRPPVPPRLEATFYRGNDERDPALYNGGHYLTSTFDLAVMDAYGEPLRAGQDISGQDLWLRFIIRRGPHTPDFFWTPDILGDIFLTTNADPLLGYERPVADRIDLETLEEMNSWSAEYRLGTISGNGDENLERVVYVADAWHKDGRMVGATFHYGIVVQLNTQGGLLQESSEVYMGALFRPRKSPITRVPREEWLSHEPIPPLPAAQGDDPETLGITDYLD